MNFFFFGVIRVILKNIKKFVKLLFLFGLI
jgi:hypothetical protein